MEKKGKGHWTQRLTMKIFLYSVCISDWVKAEADGSREPGFVNV